MTDHSPDHAERAEVMRLARAAFAMKVSMIERDARLSDLTDAETDIIIDGVLAAVRAAALRGRDAEGEAAWRDGFNTARQCLTEDEAFTLTEDVEHDAWLDSTTRVALDDTVREGEG